MKHCHSASRVDWDAIVFWTHYRSFTAQFLCCKHKCWQSIPVACTIFRNPEPTNELNWTALFFDLNPKFLQCFYCLNHSPSCFPTDLVIAFSYACQRLRFFKHFRTFVGPEFSERQCHEWTVTQVSVFTKGSLHANSHHFLQWTFLSQKRSSP